MNNRWGNEGGDSRNAYSNSYFPPTFGLQSCRGDWSVCDGEDLQAKAIAWDASFTLGLSEEIVEKNGEKKAIFEAFRTWEDARAEGAFDKKTREELKDLELKFHLERRCNGFALSAVKELRHTIPGCGDQTVTIVNPFKGQDLQFALRFAGPCKGVTVSFVGQRQISCDRDIAAGWFIMCRGGRMILADENRREVADLHIDRPPAVENVPCVLRISGTDRPEAELRVWFLGGERTLKGKGKSLSR